MPTLDAPTLASLLTVGGNAGLTALISQLFWRTVAVAPATKDRFGPIVAVIIGVGTAIGAGVLLGLAQVDLAQATVTGVVAGLAAIGIHDVLATKAGAP